MSKLKFFFKIKNINTNKSTTFLKKVRTTLITQNNSLNFIPEREIFSNFFFKDGSLLKGRLLLGNLFKNLDKFIYSNKTTLFENNQQIIFLIINIYKYKYKIPVYI